ncbi:hypothetical protein B1C78_16010 [Thioalkalivibrio denitrificans]|uniref:Uncharacterized protein n=1 Tax=Thioalkalivibrio denitrificans TaxID=108003 RepID=A0A1V3N9R4_9GAMM|nr:hypothetical protein B1C78_16010 [Thioalkalivibrio denitrificans]
MAAFFRISRERDVKLIKLVGDLLLLGGVIVTVAPMLTRAMGRYYLFGFELTTVLLGGIALLLLACLARLELLLRR